VGLTGEEEATLDVVASLQLRFGESLVVRASSGQPMGSMMSFPMLCLINKAVVDLALADLASAGKVTWKQFRAHRCLINGDDLLYRELFSGSRDILAGILAHGSRVGLVVNKEKTMVSPVWAEINSCPFKHGRKQKKTNLGALAVRSDVTDPIGFLADSVVRRRNFRNLLRLWRVPVENAKVKLQGPIPPAFFSALWVVRDALCSVPPRRASPPNPFPVVPMPDGYDLSREEEIASINRRVEWLRSVGYRKPRVRRAPVNECKGRQGIMAALRKNKPAEEDNILKVLADSWKEKQQKKLVMEDDAPSCPTTWAWDERSKVSLLLDGIRAFNIQRREGCATPDAGFSDPGADFVPFACEAE